MWPAGSKVIGISLKDRSAILPAGHMADGAYWFDPRAGNFVSSTFYFAELPAWVSEYNAARPADAYRGAHWLDHTLPGYQFFGERLCGARVGTGLGRSEGDVHPNRSCIRQAVQLPGFDRGHGRRA